jgi:hypothetical protein
MALVLGQAAVSTAPTFITAVPAGPFALTLAVGTAGSVSISTTSGTATTFSTGAIITAGTAIQYAGFTGSSGTSLYGVASGGTVTVSYHLSDNH